MNGKNQIISLKIDKEVVDPEDVEMLEDLIIAAINEAQEKISQTSQDELSKLTVGSTFRECFSVFWFISRTGSEFKETARYWI